MMIEVPAVLTTEQVAHCRAQLAAAPWVDGRITAGHQSSQAKHNLQLPEQLPLARQLGDLVVSALERNALFVAAALPAKIFPPLFNRYDAGQGFGLHVDNAIRPLAGTNQRVRTDLSATLFLSPPEDYDGGELVVEDTYGAHRVKLRAGSMILYPASSLHRVQPITRGSRIAAFFWIQSMVRDDAARTLLFDLDLATQKLNQAAAGNPALVQLTGVYHNLLRRWADP